MTCIALIEHFPYFLKPTELIAVSCFYSNCYTFHIYHVHFQKTRQIELAKMTIFETIKTVFGVNSVETSDNYYEAISYIFINAVAYILSIWIMGKIDYWSPNLSCLSRHF